MYSTPQDEVLDWSEIEKLTKKNMLDSYENMLDEVNTEQKAKS